jgi:N-glycosylase/DNA lyase
MSTFLAWSDWRPLALPEPLTPGVLAELLDGGQAFRWTRAPDGVWQGVWSECVARLRLTPTGSLQWSAPLALVDGVARRLPAYLSTTTDLAGLVDRLPWRGDPHLARCLEAFPGLRLLRQPFGETLLCFLCSTSKRIGQIRQMIERLARRHGREIVAGFHRLPTWPELAAVSEADLRECLLGFRARYVRQTARLIAARPDSLEEIERLPYAEAAVRLAELPGVGAKVADCVLLFGAGRLEAFPVDTWIVKAMAARYGLDGWRPVQIAHFGRIHFGAHAGLAQQYLFAWERAHRHD